MVNAHEGHLFSRGRTVVRTWSAAMLATCALSLAACATPNGAGDETPAPSVSPSTQAPSPTPTEPAPEPTPTETATVVTPYNGEVLVVTAEIIDGRLEVTAMVPGISEPGGTCTLELIGSDVTSSVSSNAGNEVTYCGVMSVEVPPEVDQVRFQVGYRSETTQAKSAASAVESAE